MQANSTLPIFLKISKIIFKRLSTQVSFFLPLALSLFWWLILFFFQETVLRRRRQVKANLSDHPMVDEDEDESRTTGSLATIQAMTSLASKKCKENAAAIIPRIISGFAANPDWRQREALIRIAQSISVGFEVFAKGHVASLNSILANVFKALDDPVVFPSQPHTRAFTLYSRGLT